LPELPTILFSYFEYYQIWLNILTDDCYMKLHYKIEKKTHTHTHKKDIQIITLSLIEDIISYTKYKISSVFDANQKTC
jgi:hypothetical protein